MTTGKQLNVQNATVTTMAVEVKTLTIGARQVTQGIFKQLIEEPLIAEDGTLNGVPWGHVTWHPDKCDGGREHWHIVWQRGSELRRSRVNLLPDFDNDRGQLSYGCRAANRFLTAWVREACYGRANREIITKPTSNRALGDDVQLVEPVNKETGLGAWAHMSAAAVKAAGCFRDSEAAFERTQRPLDKNDTYRSVGTHYQSWYDQWSEANPALASNIEQAIEADVKVSLTRDGDGDFAVRITDSGAPGGVERALGLALRSEEDAILQLLLEKRSTAFEALTRELGERAKAIGDLDAEVNSWGLAWPEITAEYEAAIRAEASRRKRHRDVRTTLAQLPQLFIGG